MLKTDFKPIVFGAALILFVTTTLFAQEADQPTGQQVGKQTVTPEKKALIREMRELTGFAKMTVKQEMGALSISNILPDIIEKEKELTAAQKQELMKLAEEGKERLNKQIRDFGSDPAFLAEIFEQVSIELFDTNFTEAELREIVAFYRTPTGQKTARFLTAFASKASKAAINIFSQKFKEFINAKISEEVELLKQKIKEVKAGKLEA
jgi:uncharacterized protein